MSDINHDSKSSERKYLERKVTAVIPRIFYPVRGTKSLDNKFYSMSDINFNSMIY